MIQVVDRSKAPALHTLDKLNVPPLQVEHLSNGLPVYIIDAGDQDVCSIEWWGGAGKWYEPQHLTARMTNRMLREGTHDKDSSTIAEYLDFYGASVKNKISTDSGSLIVNGLNKHLPDVLPLMAELLRTPSFPGKELDTLKKIGKQKLAVNLTKNEVIANRRFREQLYGANHPYGYAVTAEDYDSLQPDVLNAFHKEHYQPGNGALIIAGKVYSGLMEVLDDHFGDWQGHRLQAEDKSPQPSENRLLREAGKGEHQAAIRIGRPMFNKTHPDFHKMSIVNTVLGGYFSSRLMANIREDKGYTYGIFSVLQTYKHGGHFYITTEVGSHVAEDAINEIYYEIERLQQEAISAEELEQVRNYIAGKMLAGLDGPFRLANVYKGLLLYDLEIDYLYEFMDTLHSIQPADIQQLAQQYLQRNELFEVVVGKV